ncbi:hypothetical protein DV515_00006448 [Chloebia gouldiae]|uniref:Uncharacterized protein n=1 Tax=Chloebia gouldiae TaxID=44316 RepID=A0A3L8SKE7_CHLGU|nr:hypothetical protein DV515_00006448 [Chloebia gouldiae]
METKYRGNAHQILVAEELLNTLMDRAGIQKSFFNRMRLVWLNMRAEVSPGSSDMSLNVL